MACSWLSEFKSLAGRRAKLVRVAAVVYGDHTEFVLGGLWLEFAGAPSLRLRDGPTGQGFTLDEEPPDENEVPNFRDLAGQPPFAAVVDTPLQAVGLITWPVPVDDEGLSVDFPVGIRLRFEGSEVWILNVGDETELFDGEPPFWRDPHYALSEWTAEDERWAEGEVPGDLTSRWFSLATPVGPRLAFTPLLRRFLRR